MKQFYLTGLVILLVVSAAQSKKIIRNPAIGRMNTERISVAAVELTDTAAILHMDIYNSPNYWVKILSGCCLKGAESGKIYKLLRSEGFKLDEKVFMPESGHMAFRLYFEPLAANEKKIHFFESDKDTDWRIYDISLVKQKRNPERKAVCCRIGGEVVNRPNSSRLILLRREESARTRGVYIPIRDGKFEYELNCDEEQLYQLIFVDEEEKGSWNPVVFVAEPGKVHFTLQPRDQLEKNVVSGGKLNREWAAYDNYRKALFHELNFEELHGKMDTLQESARYYTPAMEAWFEKMEKAAGIRRDSLFRVRDRMRKNGEDLTSEARKLNKRYDELQEQLREGCVRYCTENHSIVSYGAFCELLERFGKKGNWEEVYRTVFRPRYPESIYTQKMDESIRADQQIKVGGHYLDFTAPTPEGNVMRLSDRISGKVALIDLWASWCGSCRTTSMSMIPVYEKYKDRGFTVVGVARERKTLDNMRKAVKQDGYPWLNLVDLNDDCGIWNMYGVGNAGGSAFLVDRDGKILAVYPTAEEVSAILEKLLP